MNTDLDFEKVAQDKSILKELEKDQIIYISALVVKYNHVDKKQQRVLVVTSKGIYNILPQNLLTNIFGGRIKRKIPFNNITAVTVSRFGPEFVIHVDKEHDYRFSSQNFKMKCVECICKGFCNFMKKKMPLYYYDDMTLEGYTTTLNDLAKNSRKKHLEEPQFLDPESMKQNEKAKPESKLIFQAGDSSNVSTFEQFQLLKVLGRGAFGKVMLCQRKGTKEYYAVKSMRKENLIEKEHLEKTKTERKILEIAKHEFLVGLEYAFQTKEKIFFVMKFYRGGELFKLLRKVKRFPESQAKFFAAQVYLGLAYLHDMGYIYRDLKPENILLDIDGYIKVSDYGLAKNLKPGEKTHSLVGTPQYVPPEIIVNAGHSFPVDWWSFGILIYEMLFSNPPFYNKDHEKMFNDIKNRPLFFDESKVQISKEAKDLITGLLRKNPDERLGTKSHKEIRNHPWFSDINFEHLLEKKYVPEYIPKVGGDIDVSNFDEQFTRENPTDSVNNTADLLLLNKFQKEFEGMAFMREDI